MPSVRDQKRKLNKLETETSSKEDYSKYSTFRKKKTSANKASKGSQSKILPLFIGIVLIFALMSVTGIFSPTDFSSNQNPDHENPTIDDSDYNFSFTSLQATVFASPTCGCCHLYTEYLEDNGFTVNLITDVDLTEIKSDNQIPIDLQSCHTMILNGYFIEGHIPLIAVGKLLDEKPNIDGITLPGMPAGSPGMSGQKTGLFTILSMIDGQSVGTFGTV